MKRARYTAPIQVVEVPLMRMRIKKIADAEGISQAQVIRDMNQHGIAWREKLSERRTAGASEVPVQE